ncbi:DUF4336 domain-containing protein [Oleomonas cavernae]|uniref:DUF4336 domain-containing protein n=1 Tax=Oleomonas cavernae TaxID=2320859 RepID=A0A418WAP9_9PROT|nr:DUF4336 domain-containing protein [Oleomonas cavernae]RJF87123.1 DUF4336 domain-containing protein [Oleomonas cavernae]
MLKEFGHEIWIADGPQVAVAGFHYPTRMAVIRLADRGLFIWSPTRLTDALRVEVDALGEVRHIVAPNSLHHLFLPEWQRAYPAARLHAPPGLRKKRQDIAFDADLGDATDPDWTGEIDQVLMRGNLITTEVVFFHTKSGTVLFTDLIQQIPANLLSGWRAVVAKLDLMVGPEPSVPRKFRLAFTNRRPARDALKHLLAWPAEKVLMAHGAPVEKDAPAFLRRAFGWLIGPRA